MNPLIFNFYSGYGIEADQVHTLHPAVTTGISDCFGHFVLLICFISSGHSSTHFSVLGQRLCGKLKKRNDVRDGYSWLTAVHL